MSKRHKAREALVRALYIAECRGLSVREAFEEMEEADREIASGGLDPDAPSLKPFTLGLDEDQKRFALSIASKIEANVEDFNEKIRGVLVNWDFERVSRIDRYIMWIALAEMMFFLDIPVGVSINEAIELAKTFSTEKSPGFINGILDNLGKKMDN